MSEKIAPTTRRRRTFSYRSSMSDGSFGGGMCVESATAISLEIIERFLVFDIKTAVNLMSNKVLTLFGNQILRLSLSRFVVSAFVRRKIL
ncbi:hypothetical protein [Rhizobium leguminosarum]|uniref:hypothetical protein n=1 Tax=Rhizobium leguminosarum TaxID=384 RepID=UPI003F9BA6CA